MADHEIGNIWTSFINGLGDGTFDLRLLHADGQNLQDCHHGSNALGGSVDRYTPFSAGDTHFYLIRINEFVNGSLLLYRGVAIFDPTAGRFNRIVGVRIKKRDVFAKEFEALRPEALALTFGQEEGTWTGTQP